MAKKTTLLQLSQKKFNIIPNLPAEISVFIGELEDSFDMIIYGDSGNGKSNMVAGLLGVLIDVLDCRAEYVAFEEGSGKSMQDTLITRADLLNKIGNKITIVDHYTYDELVENLHKRRSAKIVVIDSLQASGFTAAQCYELKKFIRPRNGKIIIFISWIQGKKPFGAVGVSVEYYAQVKVRVSNLIAFPKSRFGGNNPYIIYEPLAKEKWEKKQFTKIKKQIKDAIKNISTDVATTDRRQVLQPETEEPGSIPESGHASQIDPVPDVQALGSAGGDHGQP